MTTTEMQPFELAQLRDLLAQADAQAREGERGIYTTRELKDMTGWSIARVRSAIAQLQQSGQAQPTQKYVKTIAGDMHRYAAYRISITDTKPAQSMDTAA
jgi:hypothetical protein